MLCGGQGLAKDKWGFIDFELSEENVRIFMTEWIGRNMEKLCIS